MTSDRDPATDWHQLRLWDEHRVHVARRPVPADHDGLVAEYSEFRKAEEEKWLARGVGGGLVDRYETKRLT